MKRNGFMSEKKNGDVKVTSAWVGNLLIIAIVVIVLGAAVAYQEYFH